MENCNPDEAHDDEEDQEDVDGAAEKSESD